MKKSSRVHFAAPGVLLALAVFTTQCAQRPATNLSTNTSNEEVPTSSPAAAAGLPPLSDGVLLNATVQEDAGRRPAVTGETNLPDGTEGIASIESKTTKKGGSDKFAVHGGRFRAGPFSEGGQGLEPGNYTLDVTIAIAQVQPSQVRAVIGQNGENLRGPLVERGSIGTSVQLSQDFRLDTQGKITAGTDNAAVEQSTKASLKEARAVLQALQKLEGQGREMESLRGDDVDKLRRCGDLMRALQSEAKALGARAEALPRERYAILLAAAAGELHLCVSCMSRATDQCDMARGSLGDAEKELNKIAKK
jgi:hypothetical protein